MKGKAFIPLIAGLVIGIFAVNAAVKAVRKAQAAGGQTDKVFVVRATADIDSFEEITAENVELIETTENLFLPAAERIETIEEAVGRVTSRAIAMNTPILKSMLAPEGTPPGMVGRIPEGFRAVSVPIDEVTAAGYQIRPGDWVDVIVVIDVANAVGSRETVSEVILQNVQVAAIGDTVTAVNTPGTKRQRPARSATLFVTEADVPKLHLAATQGKITLAMRGDEGSTSSEGFSAKMSDVMRSWQKKLTPQVAETPQSVVPTMTAPTFEPELDEPPPPHTVTVYHGLRGVDPASSIERTTFESKDSPKIIEVGYGPPSRSGAALSGKDRSKRSRRQSQGQSTGSEESGEEAQSYEGG